MGGTSSRSTNDYESFLATHRKLRDQKHNRFGDVSVYRNSQDSLVIIKEGWAENKEEYDTITRRLSSRAKKPDPFIITQLYQDCYVEKEWCSDNYQVCVAYDFYERTLDQELLDRKQKDPKLPFREKVIFL